MRIVPVNYFDADHCADLAVSPAAPYATMPVTNLQSNVRSDVWRSGDRRSQVFTGTFGGGVRQISHLSIWPADGSALIGAKVALKLWSDAAKTTLTRNTGAVDVFTPTGLGWGTFLWGVQQWGVDNDDKTARLAPFISWFSPVAASAFEITISDAYVDTNYFEARRIWLGDYIDAPYGPRDGAQAGWKSGSELMRPIGGDAKRLARWRRNEMRFETSFTTEADRARWRDLMYLCDPAREILVSIFPNDASAKRARDFTAIGSLEALNPQVFERGNVNRLQMALLES